MYKILASLLALVLAACAQDVATRPALEPAELSVQTNRLEQQQADIEAAIGDLPLQYLSESDYPWTYNPVPKPSFAAWLASWEGQKVEQRRSFRYFFNQPQFEVSKPNEEVSPKLGIAKDPLRRYGYESTGAVC